MKILSEYYNEENKKQASVCLHGNRYIVKMDKDWQNQYVAEYDFIDDAEDCAEDWINE